MFTNADELNSTSVLPEPTISNCHLYWNSHFLESSIDDWLAYLKHHNDRIRNPQLENSIYWPSGSYLLPNNNLAEIVYEWCKQLKQSSGVMCRTLDIYEEYLYVCISQLCDAKKARKTKENHLPDMAHQNEVLLNLTRHQTLLHLVSCFQIASKLEDSYQAVSIDSAAKLLREFFRPCDPSTIAHSEVEVLVALKYDVNFPPLCDFVDMFICKLVIVQKKKLASKPATVIAKKILAFIQLLHDQTKLFIRVIFLNRCIIFEQIVVGLYGQVKEPGNRNYENRFQQVRRNKILLAAGIISASCFVIEKSIATQVLRDLHTHINIHPEDVAMVASILLNYVI